MFRLVSLATLISSLALNVAAHSGSETAVAAGGSVALLPPIEPRTLSEPFVLLLIGFALITASRATRR